MIIKHQNKVSPKMQFIINFLSFFNRLTKITLWQLSVKQKQKFKRPKKSYRCTIRLINDVDVIIFNPFQTEAIFYFHGGGFVLKGRNNHYHFCDLLAKESNKTIYYIDYPIAPDKSAKEIINKTISVIDSIKTEYKHKDYYFLGDSAGGNLALVLLKQVKDINKTIILSPWVNLTMNTPLPQSLEEKEFMFTKEELLEAANLYKGELSLENEIISPIFGDYKNEQIIIFAGERDILFPDIVSFHQKNNNVTLYQYPDLPHDFMFISNTKEEVMVVSEIAKVLLARQADV